MPKKEKNQRSGTRDQGPEIRDQRSGTRDQGPEIRDQGLGNSDQCESCQEYKNGWKRALADYENLQRDMAQQLGESRNRIKSDFVHQLLPVMDNFAQAVLHAPHPERAGGESKDLQNWLQGVLYIQKQFEDVLQSLGLEKIDTSGDFDPNLHEAVGEGEEAKEVKAGWKMGDTVIRPAQVIVKSEK